MKASNPLLTANLFVIQLDGDLVFLTAGLATEHVQESIQEEAATPASRDLGMRQAVRRGRHQPGLRVHKMRGVGDIWEAYVDRANRVTYEWERDTIVLRMNCNHQMLTRNP